MSRVDRTKQGRTDLAELLQALPEPTLAMAGRVLDQELRAAELRSAELRRSIRTVAALNHGTEAALVRAVTEVQDAPPVPEE